MSEFDNEYKFKSQLFCLSIFINGVKVKTIPIEWDMTSFYPIAQEDFYDGGKNRP